MSLSKDMPKYKFRFILVMTGLVFLPLTLALCVIAETLKGFMSGCREVADEIRSFRRMWREGRL